MAWSPLVPQRVYQLRMVVQEEPTVVPLTTVAALRVVDMRVVTNTARRPVAGVKRASLGMRASMSFDPSKHR
ncbi:hypothetical protein D3C85_1658640 [compost metagenome]